MRFHGPAGPKRTASRLLSFYRKNLRSRRQRFRSAFSAITGYAQAGTHPAVSTSFVPEEVVSLHDPATYGRAPFSFSSRRSIGASAPNIFPFPKFRKTSIRVTGYQAISGLFNGKSVAGGPNNFVHGV